MAKIDQISEISQILTLIDHTPHPLFGGMGVMLPFKVPSRSTTFGRIAARLRLAAYPKWNAIWAQGENWV